MKTPIAPDRAALLPAWLAFAFVLPVSIAGANIAWALVLAALLSKALGGACPPLWRLHSGLLPSLTLYCLAAALALCSAPQAAPGWAPFRQDLHKLWLCLLFSIGLSSMPRDKDPLLWSALAAGFCLSCAAGIFQTLTQRSADGAWLRAHAFVHPVTFGEQAAFAVLGAACSLALPSEAPPAKTRLLAKITLLLSATALLLSQTRGAIAGAFAGLAVLGLARAELRRFALAGAALSSIGLFASDLLPTGRSLLQELGSRPGSVLQSQQLDRLTLWDVAWRMFLDHPWLGAGPGRYRLSFPLYFQGRINNETAMGTAHNLYLHHMAERGTLGLLALACLCWALWSRSLARARSRPDAWSLWAFSATAAFLVMNLTEVAMQVEQVWMLFFFIWIWSEARYERENAGG